MSKMNLPAIYLRRSAGVQESPMLVRLREERAAALDFVTRTIEGAESRDLSATELETLERTKARVGEIDAQIKPLADFEQLRAASQEGSRTYRPAGSDTGKAQPAGAKVTDREYSYRSAGEILADWSRARVGGDQMAVTRLESVGLGISDSGALENRAVATTLLADIPALLPVKIAGPIDNALDAARPLMASFGIRPLADKPGTKFQRPYISQHVNVGKQTTERTELTSRKLTISTVDFVKETWGGALGVSRQDLDWSDPNAWDAILADFQEIYAQQTEAAVSAGFATAVTQTQELTTALAGTPTVPELIAGLYGAAVKVYQGAGRMPNHIWQDLTQWAQWGTVMDSLTATAVGAFGSKVGEFVNALMNVPRTVVPSFSAATTILGVDSKYEVYEERIGFLSAVQPTILGVDLAYGGYLAYGTVRPNAFCKIVNLA